MHYGLSALSLIPVRKDPSEKSEMITQILFGEHFEIVQEMGSWCNVRLALDDYTGWIDRKMITPIDESFLKQLENNPVTVSAEIVRPAKCKDDSIIMVLAGSTLPAWESRSKKFTINNEIYSFSGKVFRGRVKDPRILAVKLALKFVNAPYQWGGRSPFGIDCSGFSQIIYKMIGIRLPRDSSQQANEGHQLGSLEESEPGDLAFFDNEKGNIVHVGIICKQNKIIHASGKVRVDNLDQFGIFNTDLKRYTHKLRVMNKIINDYGTG
jgi:gamma-D-glutamyl-L-lysine dipeptidyl-peptidase